MKWRPSLAPPSGSPAKSDLPQGLVSDQLLNDVAADRASEGPPIEQHWNGGPTTTARYQPIASRGGPTLPVAQPCSPNIQSSLSPSPRGSTSSYAFQPPPPPRTDLSVPGRSSSSGPSGLAADNLQGPADDVGGMKLSGGAAAAGTERSVSVSPGAPEGSPDGPVWGPGTPDAASTPRDDRDVSREPRALDGASSDTGSSSVALDVEALNRTTYVKAPLGSFREPLIHMKLREFARAHHGVFGICTLNGVAGWIMTTQFLAILVALMACPRADDQANSQPFIEPSTPRGAVVIYSFCSLLLTYILALKFAGPRMLADSEKVSKVMCVLLICIGFSIQILFALEGTHICDPGERLSILKKDTVLGINVIYTQIQLIMFVCSMFNTLYWPRLYEWWFCTYSIRLWHLVKKHKIKLEIPDAVKRAVDAAGPKARTGKEGA